MDLERELRQRYRRARHERGEWPAEGKRTLADDAGHLVESEEFKRAFREYRRVAIAAARAGLSYHSDIAPLVEMWREFNDRDSREALRAARLRAPSRITRPLTTDEQRLFDVVAGLLLDDGLSMAKVRQKLLRYGMIRSRHREKFRRLMARLGVTLAGAEVRTVMLRAGTTESPDLVTMLRLRRPNKPARRQT
jgi:hypothetical protein